MRRDEIKQTWTPVVIRAYVRRRKADGDLITDFEVRVPGARELAIGGKEQHYSGSFSCSAYRQFISAKSALPRKKVSKHLYRG